MDNPRSEEYIRDWEYHVWAYVFRPLVQTNRALKYANLMADKLFLFVQFRTTVPSLWWVHDTSRWELFQTMGRKLFSTRVVRKLMKASWRMVYVHSTPYRTHSSRDTRTSFIRVPVHVAQD